MKRVITLVILSVTLFTAGCRFSSHKSPAVFPVEKEMFGKEQEEEEEEIQITGMPADVDVAIQYLQRMLDQKVN